MREVYGVAAIKTDNGFICTSKEFGIKDLLIEGDDKQVHKELLKLIKDKMVFDTEETYFLRAPYEQFVTVPDDSDSIFLIRIDPRELDFEAVTKNTAEWKKKNEKNSD